MKFKGIELIGDFKIQCTNMSFKIINEKGKVIYTESINGYWEKYMYDDSGNQIYYEDSNGLKIDTRGY